VGQVHLAALGQFRTARDTYDPFSYRMLWPGKRIENLLSGVPERIGEAMASEE
jgi:hypothetical protein